MCVAAPQTAPRCHGIDWARRLQARGWYKFTAVTFALLAVIGSTLNLGAIVAVRMVLAVKGVKSPALLTVAKATTYMVYLGVWISFQSTISGINTIDNVMARLNDDIGTTQTRTIMSMIAAALTVLLTPMQLTQIFLSYSLMYRGLMPMISVAQVRVALHPLCPTANIPHTYHGALRVRSWASICRIACSSQCSFRAPCSTFSPSSTCRSKRKWKCQPSSVRPTSRRLGGTRAGC